MNKPISQPSLLICILTISLVMLFLPCRDWGEWGRYCLGTISAIIFYRMFGGWKGAFADFLTSQRKYYHSQISFQPYHYVGMAAGKEAGSRESAISNGSLIR